MVHIHPDPPSFLPTSKGHRSLNICLPLLTVSLPAISAEEDGNKRSYPAPPLLPCAMSLLEKLWDDTVAGPQPDSGLGKLRKYNTFNTRPSSGTDSNGGIGRSAGDESTEEGKRVSRRIMIVKPPGYQNGSPLPSPSSSTPPISPAGSTPPVSPFSANNRQPFRFRRKSTGSYEKTNEAGFRDSSSP